MKLTELIIRAERFEKKLKDIAKKEKDLHLYNLKGAEGGRKLISKDLWPGGGVLARLR